MSKIKELVNSSIKKGIKYQTHRKTFVKLLRDNKRFKVMKNNKFYKDGCSLQFQSRDKETLIITKPCRKFNIQIHVDKYFQLVKFMKIRTKKRYKFINQTNRFTRAQKKREYRNESK